MRVLTLNHLAPEYADWPRRRDVLRQGIRELDADLIALQETVEPQDIVGEGYHVVRHSKTADDGVGAALASRWPILATTEVDLHVTQRVDLPWAAAVIAEIDTPVGRLIFVHHKPSWQFGLAYERELQAVVCARAVEDQVAGRDVHVVLAGDFDDTPDSASVRFWTGRQSLHGFSVAYHDAGPGRHTFTPLNPLIRQGEHALETGRRIDYIMVRSRSHGATLEVTDSRLVFDTPVDGVWASDHFGVVADMRAPAHRPGTWAD
jgi:endonuclease/exonuclease/phosphatase family metal-dependent hydrolase